jgi:hypothetical protein
MYKTHRSPKTRDGKITNHEQRAGTMAPPRARKTTVDRPVTVHSHQSMPNELLQATTSLRAPQHLVIQYALVTRKGPGNDQTRSRGTGAAHGLTSVHTTAAHERATPQALDASPASDNLQVSRFGGNYHDRSLSLATQTNPGQGQPVDDAHLCERRRRRRPGRRNHCGNPRPVDLARRGWRRSLAGG